MAELLAVNISKGGIPKLPIPRGEVTPSGLVGDGRDHAKHDKPTRAISLLDLAIIEQLKTEGYSVGPGILGENFTVRGLLESGVVPGSRLSFSGGVEIEVTDVRKPCFVLDAVDPSLKEVTVGRIGWMAKVVTPGFIEPGEAITHTPPHPEAGSP